MLAIEGLAVDYQELRALKGVSLKVAQGDLVALIGSNGAGKTTLLNAVSGLVSISEGLVSWEGVPISGLPPDEVCRAGVVQVPEGRKLFPRMTVEENLEIGGYLPAARSKLKETLANVYEMFPLLAERRKQAAGSLSGGEQQMLALSRALMARPKMLMLDEPSLGLAPITAAGIFRAVAELHRGGLTVLLVSQEILQTLAIAQHGYLLENGRIILSGPANQLLADPRVRSSYLGM
jgi:branched-chain amino acid transport system ATP-binding protein